MLIFALQQRERDAVIKAIRVLNASWTPVVLLTASNVFMTFAWYGHLRFKESPLWIAILVSWGIAFFEYTLMIPANRLGSEHFTPFQLKIIQEIITLIVFSVFAALYLGEKLRWNHLGAGLCLVGAVVFTFVGREQ